MNSNAFHNVANIATLLLAGGTAVLVKSGCTLTAAGSFDCAASSIDPVYTAGAILGLQVLKLIVNVTRDGLGGLIKPQPPVEK